MNLKRESVKPFEFAKLLNKSYLTLKKSDGFSLRQWGQLAGVSAAYITLVLNSKRLPPPKTLIKLGQCLGYDPLALDELLKAHSLDFMDRRGFKISGRSSQIDKAEDKDFELITENDEVLLKSWLHLALLEFSTCINFTEDISELSLFFGVPTMHIKSVLFDLMQSGYLNRSEKGKLKKLNLKQRIPTLRSREKVRNFHRETLKKAISILDHQKNIDEFDKRLITGYTVAVNIENLDAAKLMIQKSIHDIVNKLTEGSSTEVYQFQVQLFPLSNSQKLK